MRSIVIIESLRSEVLPESILKRQTRRYRHALGGKDIINIIESEVARDSVPHVALELAARLVDQNFYAHFVDHERMFVVFPSTIVQLERGDKRAQQIAQKVGALFSIPIEQMQFLAMFEDDHPDHPEEL